MNPETPEADAAEQLRRAEDLPEDDEAGPTETPFDADPADVSEQYRAVPVEDDYDR
ncbi:hypothetical protein [Saccharopolyspora dendranthemae]|uniref:Uncharacterized protein n=1 Tax=Saccharopolyspora dendranthemae TaxID=1181886 RepID=A0A561UA05_9PSEU|nr:hypothetical protein [Saccharopolyspora dendranthemae]TWF96195.1 hypothetical protein FHU35_121196 [Saccharopolyspora dendranthemae]